MKSQALGKTIILTGIFTFLDQLTKFLVINYLHEPQIFIRNFFSFIYAENTGIAFSINLPQLTIIISTVILLVAVLYLSVKELDMVKPLSQISVALLIGGGLSNLIDRFLNGFVVDFISIWKWPTFNLADMFIVGGILLIIVFYAKVKKV